MSIWCLYESYLIEEWQYWLYVRPLPGTTRNQHNTEFTPELNFPSRKLPLVSPSFFDCTSEVGRHRQKRLAVRTLWVDSALLGVCRLRSRYADLLCGDCRSFQELLFRPSVSGRAWSIPLALQRCVRPILILNVSHEGGKAPKETDRTEIVDHVE